MPYSALGLPCPLRLRWLLVGLLAWGLAPQPSVAEPARPSALVEADWIQQDQLFTAGQTAPAKSNVAAPLPEPQFLLAHTAEVIERGLALATRLRPEVDAAKLELLAAELRELEGRFKTLGATPEVAPDARKAIYFEARRVVREIAWLNPRLRIDKLLLVKRHAAGGEFHMCDQFYGCNARPGGCLAVLVDPLGPSPKLVNLLENSVVQNGRLQGKKLEGGSFLAPELSFDGRTILFAYSEAGAWPKYQGKACYEWTPECCYHIFKCNADGSGLVQLTDGPTDDFDPCFLPNGRIAFISERRGGYLRCGRNCPVYTLFSMRADGSDILWLSLHETHEWQPSVTNDGMLVYTRWDYVDRDSDVAHHLWTCYPDGRNPRALHGNYPVDRGKRPWMEMDIRAIPGSQKFVAVAAAHHGHAFGSLVLIDLRKEDDNALAQLSRLTPEVPFPEAETGKVTAPWMVYGTPWPLSEDDYLCAYDPLAKNHGLYWLDRAGNRELIYRDPEIASISPIPLAARPSPPEIPSQTVQAAEDIARVGTVPPATVAVMNVYDGDLPWPQGTKITALRVMQVLPKLTAPPNEPRIGVASQTNARAVLGTVPVESDGSVYFEAPVGRPIYFQALDAQGMAVQSMRSATYVHPGERLTCQGCHESKHDSPSPTERVPLALQRAPSPIVPEVDGSNPFSYVRLVQPVLDRNCVACHQEKKALDLSGTLEPPHGWTRSYLSLAKDYGFYFEVFNGSIDAGIHGGSRTVPGQFGAHAAKLTGYLDGSHYGVKLSPEDRHRITLWLDSNSEFFGAYEQTDRQSHGEAVRPSLE